MIPRRLNKGEKFGSLLFLWNQLIDHLHSIRLVAGKGIKISKLPAGTVIEALPISHTGSSNVVNAPAGGSFVVSSTIDDNGTVQLNVSAGFVSVNGKTFTMTEQQIDIKNGLLCISVKLDEKTGCFKDPILEYGMFDAWHFPIAVISEKEGGVDIKQYPVTVATFMLTKMCVFAKAASNEQ